MKRDPIFLVSGLGIVLLENGIWFSLNEDLRFLFTIPLTILLGLIITEIDYKSVQRGI